MIDDQLTHEMRLFVPAFAKETFTEYLLNLGLSGFVEGSILNCDIAFEYGDKHLQHDYFAEHDSSQSPFVFFSVSKQELEENLASIQGNLSEVGLTVEQLRVEWIELKDDEWKESWKESFRPLFIGNELVVLPPWENAAKFDAPIKIVIDPGMAFGTGQHDTTQLCLSLYLYHTPRTFTRVFDVGSGSGILSFASKKLGCGYVLGCDIDPDSVRIAAENAAINGCEDIRFTNERLDLIPEKDFDLIFANIQAKPLALLLKDIVARGAVGCTYIFSGILKNEQETFFESMKHVGLETRFLTQQGDWLGIIAVK